MKPLIYRQLNSGDYADALVLYNELVGEIPVVEGALGKELFNQILEHSGTVIWGAEIDGMIASIATLHTLPNMTFGGRPYCLIENVVTLKPYQGQGLATHVMNALIQQAWAADAYKIMLLTGKSFGTKGFYEKLGFSNDQKFGMMLRRAPARKPKI